VVAAGFALLIATGYALYYLVSDDTHPPVSMLHWALGLALAPILIAHIVVGRRSRGRVLDVGFEPRRHRTTRANGAPNNAAAKLRATTGTPPITMSRERMRSFKVPAPKSFS
jgi:hypothetical protein